MAAASEIFPMASRPASMARMTPFLVKVTDSALNSLNETLKSGSSDRGSSSITFSANGECLIRFSSKGKPFKFTMSDMQKDMSAKGPVEAVEHFANTGRWQKLGLTTYRATVMATDDSYQSTKRKAMQAEEEAKKVSAKVLKQPKGSTKASAKMWKKVCDTAQAAVGRRPLGKVTDVGKAASFGSANSAACSSSSSTVLRGLDVRKKPLRERIVHHLLVSSCGAKELLDRMTKEGLTVEEGQNFDVVFNAVAQPKNGGLSSKSNADDLVYELKPQCLSEVSDDWPFYSAWHRQVAKRALATRLSDRPKATAASQLIPERQGSTKCRPIAGGHNAKTKRPAEVVPLPAGSKERRLGDGQSSAQVVVNTNGHQKDAEPLASKKTVANVVAQSVAGSSDDRSERSPSSTTTVDLGLWDEYPEIDTHADRQRYKELFDRDYPDYQQCYSKLKALVDEFTALGATLNGCKQGSTEYEAVERQISTRYRQLVVDRSLDKLRKEHDGLRRKLAVIKARVTAFDKRCESDDDDEFDHKQQQLRPPS